METSDSECFESAGEEFYSDDEKAKNDDKVVVGKPKSSSSKDRPKRASNLEDKTSEKRQTIESREEGNLNKLEAGVGSGNEKVDKLTQNVEQVKECVLPTRSVCWEPGVDYELEEEKVDAKDSDTRSETLKTKDYEELIRDADTSPKQSLISNPATKTDHNQKDAPNQDVENSEKRRGFGTPPEIAVCWEEGVNTILCKPKIVDAKQPQSSLPEVTQCWEEGVNTLPSKSTPTTKVFLESTSKDKTKPDLNNIPENAQIQECQDKKSSRSEFGIPPQKVVCPFPPQYREQLELKKNVEKKEESEENMWGNDDWCIEDEIDNLKVQKDDPKIICDDPKPSQLEIDTSQHTEENMWEDDNWDDFEDTNETKQPDIPKQEKSQRDEGNMWEDDWEPIENIPKIESKTDIQDETKKDTGWGSWGSWGLSSVISTATNITNQVSQSLTTVLESGIGAPNPEELAKIDREIEKELQDIPDNDQEEACERREDEKPILGFGLGTLVHGMTKLVETTGSKVITGGLDTLETIGKKTMEVLQENDPGLKKKRAFLKLNDDKPILSHMLREAKEKAEEENRELEKKHLIVKKPNYETLFDDHQGLVHLEALEMLSKQCDIKLSTLLDTTTGESLLDIQETMDQIKELCELPEEEEEEILTTEEIQEKLADGVKELNVPITYDRLLSTWNDVESWLENVSLNIIDSTEIHQQAIESLAQLTAIAVEQFHKGGELLLVKKHRSTADEADSLVQLTVTLTALIGIVSAKFSEKLNMALEKGADKKEVNELITNVFFEAANSSTYIRDAFQLLIPVLQVGAV